MMTTQELLLVHIADALREHGWTVESEAEGNDWFAIKCSRDCEEFVIKAEAGAVWGY